LAHGGGMKLTSFKQIVENEVIETSAPCRIDMGGTLDISTFYYPLQAFCPCTFNISMALRTRVRLLPFKSDWVRVSLAGFEDAAFPMETVPFRHPLGLMFAVAAFFNAAGIHIQIESASPVRSALGGSSVAALALITALSRARARTGPPELSRRQAALLAHGIEQSVAGVPCGLQDQLAAAFGGVNAWYWTGPASAPGYQKRTVIRRPAFRRLEQSLLLAYCGMPHVSKDINGTWVRQFLSGQFRSQWAKIIALTHAFVDHLAQGDLSAAAQAMNRETVLRQEMTPEVLDEIGLQLTQAAQSCGCGARFTGAGGGGCIWALGNVAAVQRLKPRWEEILSARPEAGLLNPAIDPHGVL
jgi:D-glycero-alpha-D-manno-heptose-7-phosphate kinase